MSRRDDLIGMLADGQDAADCIEWPYRTDPSTGYGQLSWRVDGKKRDFYAHRVAWEAANRRPIPQGQVIMHTCDNRLCINPRHLEVGTQTQNLADMRSKNRQARGRMVPQHELTELDVLDIVHGLLVRGETQKALAARYGVAQPTISDIVRGSSWGWLTGLAS